jgi:hypothetical protein
MRTSADSARTQLPPAAATHLVNTACSFQKITTSTRFAKLAAFRAVQARVSDAACALRSARRASVYNVR